MQIQSFNAELAMANLMFLRLFNNITIQRTDKNNTKKNIKVNCQLGQASRIYKNWQNSEKKAQMKLPTIAINRTGYTRNGERLNNMHNEVKYELTQSKRLYDLLTPIPVDISYDVVIMAKYQSDIDQIASNFMVFFNPDVYVTCVHPKYEGIKLNNQIIMSDSVSEEHPDEMDGSTDDFITTTFQFTFKTYLFGGTQQSKKIKKFILSTYISNFISTDISYQTSTYISTSISVYPSTTVSNCISVYYNDKLSTIETVVNKKTIPINASVEISNQLSTEVRVTSYVDVSSELSTVVLNPEYEDNVYNGFTPIIKKLNLGFYSVPQLCDYEEYFDFVESRDPNWMFVDKITWQIDEDSSYPFPQNIKWVNANKYE